MSLILSGGIGNPLSLEPGLPENLTEADIGVAALAQNTFMQKRVMTLTERR